MPRHHIDYLQTQALPWQTSPWPHLGGCQIKTLSRDPDSGALSLIVRIPSGWAAPLPDAIGATEELFVLDGLLELDGCRYGPDCYGRFPAGWRHTVRVAAEGAVALAFYDAAPLARPGAALAEERREPARADAFERRWVEDGSAVVFGAAGQRCKVLHGTPQRGPATLLVSAPPYLHPPGWSGPQELHGCAHELFVLSGDLLSPLGQLVAGAYASRPAHVAHGPYGSRGGCVALLRTHGAARPVEYTTHELTLDRAPAYRPVLPPELKVLLAHPWRAQRY